jgi:arylsulfatase A-like enzyme
MIRMAARAIVTAVLVAIEGMLLSPAGHAAESPNFIIILADDMGYGDLGCYGHPSIRTPNLDRMAAEGMRFTDFYVAGCVCTPSRAALLTGRLPVRSGMAGTPENKAGVLLARSNGGLPTNEITIAAALRAKGYATACIGKWHLGRLPQYLPTHHGFDSFFGLRFSNDMEPAPGIPRDASSSLNPKPEWWRPVLYRDDKPLEGAADLRTLTQDYTREALQFIRSHRQQPFFLYFAHTYPHVPLFASKAFQQRSLRGLYGDVVEELDWSVGQVFAALREEGLAEKTLVFFTSDNGPWLNKKLAGGSAGPFRDGKGSTWEGGMREPGIAWWPGHIPTNVVNHGLACSMDLFPTLLGLAGAPIPADRIIDGLDMAPMLFGKGISRREVMFYYRYNELYAVRKGPFKAHFITYTGYSPDAPQKHDPPLLFQLENDPGEKFDVAAEHPEVVADIQREVAKHQEKLVPVEPQF